MRTSGSILFLTRSLDVGGSERQLVTLASELRRRGWSVEVAVFYGGGAFQEQVEDLGIPVHDLAKRSRWDLLGFVWRLSRRLRQSRPTIVHSYLVDANLLALTARFVWPPAKVVWGVRASFMDLTRSSWAARLAFALSCRTARFAHRVIFNSRAGCDYHEACGYPHDRGVVIQNGIDTNRWRADPDAGGALRRAWGVGPSTILIGIVARVDPIKGHETFLRAAALMARDRADIAFVVAGSGDYRHTTRLGQLATELGIRDRVIWAGGERDPRVVYNALDIVTSSSHGEGFPNVLAEAMACERICVGTDVGDTRELLGDDALCVPSRDAAALHSAWVGVLGWDARRRASVGERARERIVRHFSIATLADRTEQVFATLGVGGP